MAPPGAGFARNFLLCAVICCSLSGLAQTVAADELKNPADPVYVLQKDFDELRLAAGRMKAEEIPGLKQRATAGDKQTQLLLGMLYNLSLAFTVVPQSHPPLSSPEPQVTVNLERLGWKDVTPESDKEFFKDFSLEKLEARDGGVNLVFLNEDVLVAYHGTYERQKGADWRSVHRILEAFFINAKDGALLLKRQWATNPRKAEVDAWDSEARLIRLSDERFLVQASGVLMLYSSRDYSLLKEKKLDPLGFNDVWAMQSVPGGLYVVLRHGQRSRIYAKYEWLDADNLETRYRAESYSLWRPVATDDSLMGGSDSGIQRLQFDGSVTTICQKSLCADATEVATLSSHSIVFLARNGVGIVDADQGLLWRDPINPRDIPQIGGLCSAASGERFAFFAAPWKNASFHGEKLGRASAVLVYNAKTGLFVSRLPAKAWFCALSPNGSQIAIADWNGFRTYLTK